MYKYIKKTLFALLIFMMPYMNSLSMAMDDGDYEGSSLRIRKLSLMTEDQKDISFSVKQSTSSQVESLENSQNSWSSYLISSVKAPFQIANEFMNLAVSKPKLAMVVGFAYTLQLAAAANCTGCYQCICDCTYPSGSGRGPFTYGKVENTQTCINVCQAKTQWIGGFVGCR